MRRIGGGLRYSLGRGNVEYGAWYWRQKGRDALGQGSKWGRGRRYDRARCYGIRLGVLLGTPSTAQPPSLFISSLLRLQLAGGPNTACCAPQSWNRCSSLLLSLHDRPLSHVLILLGTGVSALAIAHACTNACPLSLIQDPASRCSTPQHTGRRRG